MFSGTEWHEIGDLLWHSAFAGGNDRKPVQELRAVWKTILNTLQTVSSEKKVAKSVIQTLEGVGDEKRNPETFQGGKILWTVRYTPY